MTSDSDSKKELPKMNPKIVQSLIHQKLDEIRAGELESSHDLPPSSLHKISKDDDLYKTFEAIIAKTWMEIDMMTSNESGLNGGQLNRRKKMYVETLRKEREFCKTQIKEYNFIPHAYDNGKEVRNIVNNDHRHHDDNDDEEEDDSMDEDDDEEDNDDTVSSLSDAKVSKSTASIPEDSKRQRQQEKKKKKKDKKKKDKKKKDKKKKKKKHRKSSSRKRSNSEHDDQDGTSEQDEDVLNTASISSRDEKRLHEKERKAKLLFENEKAEILKQIPKDVSDDFLMCGYCKWNKEYLPCIQLGPYHVPPGEIRDQWMDQFENAIEQNKPTKRIVFWYGTSKNNLSSAFSFINHKDFYSYKEACELGFNKIPKALQKKVDQGSKLTSKEQYKVDGLKQIEQEVVLPKDKRLTWLLDFEEDYESYLNEVNDLTSEESIKPPKKKKEKSEKRKREDSVKEKSKKQKTRSLDDEIAAEVKGEKDMFEMEDSASDDDINDDDFSMSDSESDENFEADDEKKSTKRKLKSKEEDDESPTNEQKKRGRPKKAKSEKDIAQENFEDCEKVFLPLMQKLKDCKHSHDAEKYVKLIGKDVNILTPSFIKVHQIGILIKDIRAKFKNNEHLNQECKSVTSAMKKVYHDKLDSEPTDFKPKLKSEKKEKKEKSKDKKVSDDTITQDKSANEEKHSMKSTSVAAVLAEVEKKKVIPVSEDLILDVKMKVESSKPVKIEPKPARKSFSLADMFEQKETVTTAVVGSTLSNQQTMFERPPAPKWITNYLSTGPSYETDPERIYAMQFLLDATSCLPENKVDRASVARALEDALFTKYDGDIDNYMQRLHDVCAAIAGKKVMGSVAQKIISGDYQTPVEVINIPRKLLFQSFEGFWVP